MFFDPWLFSTARSSNVSVIGIIGQNVILPCQLSACWGRGAIPNRGCADEVLKSDGTSVVGRLSERYQLLGRLNQGDMSLTIRHVEESDSGMYGCRVEIPGWFNDQKQQLTLRVVAESQIKFKSSPNNCPKCMFSLDQPPKADLRNGVVQSYSISYREYDRAGRQYKKWQQQSVTATREQESVILNNLKPSTQYEVLIQAKTNAGIGPATTAALCSTLDEGKKLRNNKKNIY
uniref:Ig-like domain-containing protein n=1 Tax=Monopterus albus TaxID=43700 RepID=A0A3Q3IY40_MONAL